MISLQIHVDAKRARERRMPRTFFDAVSAGHLRRVSIDGEIELADGGRIHTPVRLVQLTSGRINFAADFCGSFESGNRDFDGLPAVRLIHGRDRDLRDCTVRTRGPVIITHLQSEDE